MGEKKFYKDQLFDLIKELKRSKVDFIVCGGVASVLHGIDRNTYDLDISVDLKEFNLSKLLKVARKFDLIPRIPEPVENFLDEDKRKKWVEKKGALVYTFVSENGPLQMDIFLKYPRTYDELYLNADKIQIGDLEILISSKEDLLVAKKGIAQLREKDLLDIKELERMIYEEKKSKSKN